MRLWFPGSWGEGGTWAEARWERCPHAPAWVTGRRRPLCEGCLLWADRNSYPIPGGVHTYGDCAAVRPEDPVQIGAVFSRSLRDRAHDAAARAGMSFTEWLRFAARDTLDREDPPPPRTLGEAADGAAP